MNSVCAKMDTPTCVLISKLFYNHILNEIDNPMFSNKSRLFLFDLSGFAHKISSSPHVRGELRYRANRKPDPQRIQSIVDFQRQYSQFDNETAESRYRTQDWMITLTYIGKPSKIRGSDIPVYRDLQIIDGQHRYHASKELPGLVCMVNLIECEDWADVHAEYRRVNLTTNIPQIYLESEDDFRANVVKKSVEYLQEYQPEWFIGYSNQIQGGLTFPFFTQDGLVKSLGEIIDHIDLPSREDIDTIDDAVEHVVGVLKSVNDTLCDDQTTLSGFPLEFVQAKLDHAKTSDRACGAYCVNSKSRCIRQARDNGFCGYHKSATRYVLPLTMGRVREVASEYKCFIGLFDPRDWVKMYRHLKDN